MGRESELIEAARAGNYPQVERILSTKPKKAGPFASLRRAGGGISSRDSRGYTALHYAALNGHREVAGLLLSYEASCNSVDQAGSSPLHLAAWAGHGDLVRVLLETGPSVPNVNLTNGDKETALHCAAQYGHIEPVKLLLDAGAEPNIKNSREETALDHAAQYGRIETVRLLLETHPEMVGKYTAYGGMLYTHTPLHLASRNGHREVVQELLRVGMDINVRTSRGTALHEAALCGKVEVVRSLLENNINPFLRDSADRTVLDVMAELQTQRTREISKIILSHSGASAELASPYENHPHPHHPLTESPSVSPVRPRAPSWVREPRGARSVEELDKRISSFSTTSSGCSDCTTSTLQGAKSYESSFMSESEVTMTGTLTRGDDDTSISSASSSSRQSLTGERPGERPVSQNTLTSTLPSKPLEKPKVPAKPAHIRPGLKPVQIPNVDDKLGLKPRKPPRRNHSISPVRSHCWESEGYDDSSSCSRKPTGQKTVYSSKAGSKSFDELDDILSEKPSKPRPKRGRRTMSTISGSDLIKAKESRDLLGGGCCEEPGLVRSYSDLSDCQRCLLSSLSNRTLTEDNCESSSRERYISQKQYKRKIRREGSSGQQAGYSTLDSKDRRMSSGHDRSRGCTKIVSKTTYKLKKFNGAQYSELDSAGEESYEKTNGLELMEIPLSPTHYEQPPTPEHDPPTPWEAESAIHSAISFLRAECSPRHRNSATMVEPWLLLSLDPAQWPSRPVSTRDQASQASQASQATPGTGRDKPGQQIPRGRKLPDLPLEARKEQEQASSEEDSPSEPVVMRNKPASRDNDSSIYQTIGDESDESEDRSRRTEESEKSESVPILSPFNEQEEWSKISQILNSFGADIGSQTEGGKDASTPNNSPVYDYPTLKRREKLAATVQEWLRYINMEKYLTNFEGHGYDNINFIGGGVITKEDLHEIGVTDSKDCSVLIDSLKDRKHQFDFDSNQEPKATLGQMRLEEWLASIKLERYVDNFRENLITDMERVTNIWDEELLSILEIDRVGHRKRILLSVAGPKGLKARSGKVKVDTIVRKSKATESKKASTSPSSEAGGCSHSTTESDVSVAEGQRRYTSTSSASETSSDRVTSASVDSATLTLGRRKKKAPAPPGQVSPQMKSKERSRPAGYNTIERSGVRQRGGRERQTFSASFKANYHGNNLVKDFNGIETTREAIERVKTCRDIINRTGMPVTMLISDTEVKITIFEGQEPLHQHQITNISCIVYDTDNMCMFGYITTDIPNLQRYSHVFSAENKEKASEILTAICKGYKEGASKAASKDTHSLRKSSHKKSSHDIELRESKKVSKKLLI